MVHRDLKPANVILSSHHRPILVDFDLARSVHDSLRLTQTREILGTPLYLSPEQVRGGGEITPAIDVWALGVILYETLTGTEPFPAESSTQMYQKIQEENPLPPHLRDATIPGDWEVLSLQALEKDPPRRHRNADEFGRALRRWLDGVRVQKEPCRLLRWLARLLSR